MKRLLALSCLMMVAGCGTPMTVVKKVYCGGTAPSGLFAEYLVTYYNDNTIEVHCEIAGSNLTTSSTWTWFPSESDYATATCYVGADIDTPTFGSWMFVTTGDKGSAQYKDSSSQSNNFTLSLSCRTTKHE